MKTKEIKERAIHLWITLWRNVGSKLKQRSILPAMGGCVRVFVQMLHPQSQEMKNTRQSNVLCLLTILRKQSCGDSLRSVKIKLGLTASLNISSNPFPSLYA